MKKKLIMITMLALFGLNLFACKDNKEKFISAPDNFSYYPKTKMNSEKKLLVFNNNTLSFEERILAQAIQGIFAQKEVTYYTLEGNMYQFWLDDLIATYGVTTEMTTVKEMVQNYQANYEDFGYILYDKNLLESVNVASSLAGITNYIPIDSALIPLMEELGIPLKLDVKDKKEKWLFDNYQNEFNYSAAIQLRGDIPHLRDFGIANKYIFFYQEGLTSQSLNLRRDIHSKMPVDSPLFGWGPGPEESHVGIASQMGQFTIPSDYSYNMTVFTALDFYNIKTVKHTNEEVEVTPEAGKHYITIVRSDGDNVQTWYNYFPFSNKDMASGRFDFPMGWSMQPSLIDLAPNIMKYVYETADKNDYFVAAVSGHGYMYPKTYNGIDQFMSRLSMYLRKSDLSVVQILDSSPNLDVIEKYSKIPELMGAMYMYGEKYAGGKGSIYWSQNGKPFVSFRESLWDADINDLAFRINSYKRDYKSIEGYTLINLHPWSMSYNDVSELLKLLNDDVIVLSPNNFIKMIKENVKKENIELS